MRKPRQGRAPHGLPAALHGVAAVALLLATAALAVAARLLLAALAGTPLTTPLQLLDPGLALLQPGEVLAPFPGAPPLTVTDDLVRAVAAANIVVFGGGGVLWLLAAVGLWARRAAARALAVVLYGILSLVALLNLGVEALLLLLYGPLLMEEGGGLGPMIAGMAAFALLLATGAGALWILSRPGTTAILRGGAAARPPLVMALVCHFALVAVLLLPGSVLPAAGWPPRLLLGPWLLTGLPARLITLALAAVHGALAWAWWRHRRWAVSGSLWLNGALAVAALGSAATAGGETLALLAAGALPPGLVRWLLVAVAVLAGSLLLAIPAAGRRLAAAPRPARG